MAALSPFGTKLCKGGHNASGLESIGVEADTGSRAPRAGPQEPSHDSRVISKGLVGSKRGGSEGCPELVKAQS
jgi:hypothetical protein